MSVSKKYLIENKSQGGTSTTPIELTDEEYETVKKVFAKVDDCTDKYDEPVIIINKLK